jgi:hypothetical protein
MELSLIIIVVVVIFYFRRVLAKTANLAESTIGVLADTSDDTLHTYANDIHIANSKKRSTQKTELTKLSDDGGIYTNNDITDILSAMNKETVKDI